MNTNLKGDIALSQVIADLVKKELEVFIPINDHPKADLLVIVDDKVKKIQVKYSSTGYVRDTSVNRKGVHVKYKSNEIDIYACYIPQIDSVVYVPFSYGSITVRFEKKNTLQPCWWYEDFLDIRNTEFEKREVKKTNPDISNNIKKIRDSWPDKDLLSKLIWKKPATEIAKDFNVSGRMVGKWCQHYNIETPPRGYWTGKQY